MDTFEYNVYKIIEYGQEDINNNNLMQEAEKWQFLALNHNVKIEGNAILIDDFLTIIQVRYFDDIH